MRQRLPILLSAAALVVALLGTSADGIAHGVRHALFAHNAAKVDGRSAVGARTSAKRRAGKLVATNGAGKLPNSIIAKAPDASRLDGMNSSAFALREPEAWTDLKLFSLISGWATVDAATYGLPGFYKGPTGVVRLRGAVRCVPHGFPTPFSTCAAGIVRLPEGYRPGTTRIFVTGTGDPPAPLRVDVEPDGDVRLQSSVPVDDTVWYSLDGISFRAEG